MDKKSHTKAIALLTLLFTFNTAASQKFAVIGDYGSDGPDVLQVTELIKRNTPDYIITTGDNNYPDGKSSTIDNNIGKYFSEFIYPYNGKYKAGRIDYNRFYPSIGNHDWRAWRAIPYRKYFHLPGNERYYDVYLGDVHLFVLNSNKGEPHGISKKSRQARWLKKSMTESKAVWKIVVTHHAPYVSDRSHGSAEWMHWPFKEWGADLVLSGHAHLYERSSLNGLTYIVNGLGGASRYDLGHAVTGSQKRFNESFGALFIDAEQQKLHVRFVTVSNELVDEWTMPAE